MKKIIDLKDISLPHLPTYQHKTIFQEKRKKNIGPKPIHFVLEIIIKEVLVGLRLDVARVQCSWIALLLYRANTSIKRCTWSSSQYKTKRAHWSF
jgi:hypothetical protein